MTTPERVGHARIEIMQDDITKLPVDAVVNAANPSLSGGGGVDGAIHRAAGPRLLEACRKLGGCRTGEAKITAGYRLPAKYVIHTVGPVWRGGNHHEPRLLENCYRNSLLLAAEYGLASVAFPAVSTGIYGFPFDRASRIAIQAVRDFLKDRGTLSEIIFVLFGRPDYERFQRIFREMYPGRK